MAGMAHMVAAGHLARDVDMREAGGHSVVDVTILVNQKIYKGTGPDGARKYDEDVLAVTTSFWRERAGAIASFNLKRGTFVILTGNPRIRTYPRSGEHAGETGVEIILENADLTLGPKTDGGPGNGTAGNGAYQRPAAASVPQRQQPTRPGTPGTPGARPPQGPQRGPMEAPERQLDLGDDDVPFAEAPPAGKAANPDW